MASNIPVVQIVALNTYFISLNDYEVEMVKASMGKAI